MSERDIEALKTHMQSVTNLLTLSLRSIEETQDLKKLYETQMEKLNLANKEIESRWHSLKQTEQALREREASVKADEEKNHVKEEELLVREQQLVKQRERLNIDKAFLEKEKEQIAKDKLDIKIAKEYEVKLKEREDILELNEKASSEKKRHLLVLEEQLALKAKRINAILK